MKSTVSILLAIALAASLGACGYKEDQLRTVRSYQFATCDSAPTKDPTELAALAAFKDEVEFSNFVRSKNTFTMASHEETLEASGLRQYEGPFYWYLHPGNIAPTDASQGVTWSGVAYLHAKKVRFRANGEAWGEWQPVRTRNFGGDLMRRSVDPLPRWACLVGSEVAWARLKLRDGQWEVQPLVISVYERPELSRLRPVPTRAQIDAKEAVEPMHLEADNTLYPVD